MIKDILLLFLGVFACSTAVIMIRASDLHPVLLSAYRLLFSALALSPLFFNKLKANKAVYGWRELRLSILPGIMLGLHFIVWIFAVHMTNVANATLLVNLVPIAMPFALFFMMNERLNVPELIGTVIALLGLYILVFSDVAINRDQLLGDMLCLVAMILLTIYLALGRKNRRDVSIWLYVVPLYLVGGIFCIAIAPFFESPLRPYPPKEIALIAGLVLLPTVAGHSALNHAMKNMRGQFVSIVNLSQFIFAGVMGYIFFAEVPEMKFYPASALLISGAILAIHGMKRAGNKLPVKLENLDGS